MIRLFGRVIDHVEQDVEEDTDFSETERLWQIEYSEPYVPQWIRQRDRMSSKQDTNKSIQPWEDSNRTGKTYVVNLGINEEDVLKDGTWLDRLRRFLQV